MRFVIFNMYNSMTMKNGETIINVIENKTNKHLSIGSNMKNLRFTVKK